jgi:hypothetical protein
MNKYKNWYNNIISIAKTRDVSGYVERHHIIPRSLGGNDSEENLVNLTAREHFICHWLLIKMYSGESKAKMIYALNGMKRNGQYTERYETKITSRVYENLKKEFAIIHSAAMKGRDPWNRGYKEDRPDVLENVKQAALKRKPQSKESREKQAQKTRGQKRTDEQRENISKALKGKLRGPMGAHQKEAISKSTTGKAKPQGMGSKLSATIAKQLANGTHYTQIKIQCPYCPVKSSKGKYNKYHGDRCKHKATT